MATDNLTIAIEGDVAVRRIIASATLAAFTAVLLVRNGARAEVLARDPAVGA
jgi:hypothetical protein